jgi:hypothetical protein
MPERIAGVVLCTRPSIGHLNEGSIYKTKKRHHKDIGKVRAFFHKVYHAIFSQLKACIMASAIKPRKIARRGSKTTGPRIGYPILII